MTSLTNKRDACIFCGLFLSKYNQKALNFLGFESFKEAFNTLGYCLQTKAATIKNYRDELDPLFPNKRKGWHMRPLRPHCKKTYEAYGSLKLKEMGEIIKEFLDPINFIESIPNKRGTIDLLGIDETSFAKRVLTGLAAEEYFKSAYSKLNEFAGMDLTDTTKLGCGFDYKLSNPNSNRVAAVAVEVKGIREATGAIQMTSLEYEMAKALQDKYYLFVVRNFVDKPFHSIFSNPTRSQIVFEKEERKEIRVVWRASIKT